MIIRPEDLVGGNTSIYVVIEVTQEEDHLMVQHLPLRGRLLVIVIVMMIRIMMIRIMMIRTIMIRIMMIRIQ